MLTKLLFWLLGRFLDEQARNRSNKWPGAGAGPTPLPRTASPSPPVKRGPPPADLGRRLAADPEPLERVQLVPRGRVAVLLEEGQPPRVESPKSYLWPPIVPARRPITLLAVNTEVVQLVLEVRDLVTFDGHDVAPVKVKVSVQVSDADGYAKLARMAAEHGATLEVQLLARVERELGNEVQVAVRMNRSDHLRRLTLSEVLTIRGLPHELAGGVLSVRSVEVTEEPWSSDEADRSEPEEAPSDEPAPTTDLELSSDARLRRVWSTHTETGLAGIASAQLGGSTAVVAVPRTPLGLADRLTLKEAFRRQLGDRTLSLVSSPATSYAEVVDGWFREVNQTAARLVAVRPLGPDGLRIIVDQAPRSTEGNADLPIGTTADREALRNLLPHPRVEFVTADDAAELADRRR